LKIMRYGSRPAIKDPQESPGWKGNVFYPDGPTGAGYGILIKPSGDVVFPMVPADGKKTPGPVENKTYRAAANPPQQAPVNSQGCYKLPEVGNYQGKALPDDVTGKIKALINQGLSTRAIAKQVGVSNVTVYRIMQRPLIPVD
jgi:hypothetical protein